MFDIPGTDKRSFSNISGNHGPIFPQINFDKTYFGFLSGGLSQDFIFWMILARGDCLRVGPKIYVRGVVREVYVLEQPISVD